MVFLLSILILLPNTLLARGDYDFGKVKECFLATQKGDLPGGNAYFIGDINTGGSAYSVNSLIFGQNLNGMPKIHVFQKRLSDSKTFNFSRVPKSSCDKAPSRRLELNYKCKGNCPDITFGLSMNEKVLCKPVPLQESEYMKKVRRVPLSRNALSNQLVGKAILERLQNLESLLREKPELFSSPNDETRLRKALDTKTGSCYTALSYKSQAILVAKARVFCALNPRDTRHCQMGDVHPTHEPRSNDTINIRLENPTQEVGL